MNDFASLTTAPFRETRGYSRAAVVGLWGYVLAAIAMIVIELIVVVIIRQGELSFVTFEQLEVAEQFTMGIAVFIFLFTMVTYCTWKHRSYHNLKALGVGLLRYSPNWAIGSYFVPILNLVRPFRAMNDIWNGTFYSPLAANVALVSWWWTAWIIGNMVTRASKGVLKSAETVDSVTAGIGVGVLGGLIMIAAALTLIRIIGRVTAAQYARRTDGGSIAPQPLMEATV